MERPRKKNRPVTVRMGLELYERLEGFCEKSGQPKTVDIERALKAYINNYDAVMKRAEEK